MSFDKSIAIEAAELIHALYRGGIAPTINERSTDTQCLVQRVGDVLFVVFPGTDSIADWQTDLRAAKVEHPRGGKVHAGFKSAWKSVMWAVTDNLCQRGNSVGDVVVCGHSLGGALAVLCAFELIHLPFIPSVQCYTFGQPRVGNGSFTRYFNANLHDETYRIVNEHDPVPYLPPWLMGYRHAGTEVFLGKNSITVAPSLWEQGSTTLDALLNRKAEPDNKNFVSVAAHSINSYLKKLKG
jgi:triacylglycerol lipase